jgi:hypothetical protein
MTKDNLNRFKMLGLIFEELLKKHFKGQSTLKMKKDEDSEIDPAFIIHENDKHIIERNIR